MIDFSKLIDPNFKPFTDTEWERYEETKGNGAFGWAKDAFDSGALGVMSNLADASQEYLGFGGDLAKALGNLAEINGKTENVNPSTSGYLTNNQGLLYDVFNAVGSSAPLMVATAGAGAGVGALGRAIAPSFTSGAVASLAKLGEVAPKVTMFGKTFNPSTAVGIGAVGNIAKSIPESLAEAGGVISQAREGGYSPEQIREIGNETFMENAKTLLLSNTVESAIGLGALSKLGRVGSDASRLAKVASGVGRVGAVAGMGAVQNAFEEGAQSEIPLVAMGKSNANPWNPSEWSKESQQSAVVGAMVGGVLGGVGGAGGQFLGKNPDGKPATDTLTPVNSAVVENSSNDNIVTKQAVPQAINTMVSTYMSDPDYSPDKVSIEALSEMVDSDPVLKNEDKKVVIPAIVDSLNEKLATKVAEATAFQEQSVQPPLVNDPSTNISSDSVHSLLSPASREKLTPPKSNSPLAEFLNPATEPTYVGNDPHFYTKEEYEALKGVHQKLVSSDAVRRKRPFSQIVKSLKTRGFYPDYDESAPEFQELRAYFSPFISDSVDVNEAQPSSAPSPRNPLFTESDISTMKALKSEFVASGAKNLSIFEIADALKSRGALENFDFYKDIGTRQGLVRYFYPLIKKVDRRMQTLPSMVELNLSEMGDEKQYTSRLAQDAFFDILNNFGSSGDTLSRDNKLYKLTEAFGEDGKTKVTLEDALDRAGIYSPSNKSNSVPKSVSENVTVAPLDESVPKNGFPKSQTVHSGKIEIPSLSKLSSKVTQPFELVSLIYRGKNNSYMLDVTPVNKNVSFKGVNSIFERMVLNVKEKVKVLSELDFGNTSALGSVSNNVLGDKQVLATKNIKKASFSFNVIKNLKAFDPLSKGYRFHPDVTPDMRYTVRLADLLGFDSKNLHFFSDLKSNDGTPVRVSGFNLSSSDGNSEIFVSTEGARSSFWVFGHEFGHYVSKEKVGRKVFNELKEKVSKAFGSKEKLSDFLFDYARFNRFQPFENNGVFTFKTPTRMLTANQLLDEVVCDMIGDRMVDGNFINTVASAFEGRQGFPAYIFSAIKTFLGHLRDKALTSPESGIDWGMLNSLSSDFTKDIDGFLVLQSHKKMAELISKGKLSEPPYSPSRTISPDPTPSENILRLSLVSGLSDSMSPSDAFELVKFGKNRMAGLKAPQHIIDIVKRRTLQDSIIDSISEMLSTPEFIHLASDERVGNEKEFDPEDWISRSLVNTKKYTLPDLSSLPSKIPFRYNHILSDGTVLTFNNSDPSAFESVDSYLGDKPVASYVKDLKDSFDYKAWAAIRNFKESDFYKDTYAPIESLYIKLVDSMSSISSKAVVNDSTYQKNIGVLEQRVNLLSEKVLEARRKFKSFSSSGSSDAVTVVDELNSLKVLHNKAVKELSDYRSRFLFGDGSKVDYNGVQQVDSRLDNALKLVAENPSAFSDSIFDLLSKFSKYLPNDYPVDRALLSSYFDNTKVITKEQVVMARFASMLNDWLRKNDRAYRARVALILKYTSYTQKVGHTLGSRFKDGNLAISDSFIALCQLTGLKYLNKNIIDPIQRLRDGARLEYKTNYTAVSDDFRNPKTKEFDAFKEITLKNGRPSLNLAYFKYEVGRQASQKVSESYPEHEESKSKLSGKDIELFDTASTEIEVFNSKNKFFTLDKSPFTLAKTFAKEQHDRWVANRIKDGKSNKAGFAELERAKLLQYQDLWLEKAINYIGVKDYRYFDEALANSIGSNKFNPDSFKEADVDAPNVAGYAIADFFKQNDSRSFSALYVFSSDVMEKIPFVAHGNSKFTKFRNAVSEVLDRLQSEKKGFINLDGFYRLPIEDQLDLARSAGFGSVDGLIVAYEKALQFLSQNPNIVEMFNKYRESKGEHIHDRAIVDAPEKAVNRKPKKVNTVFMSEMGMETEIQNLVENEMNNPDIVVSHKGDYWHKRYVAMILNKVKNVSEVISKASKEEWFGLADKLLRSPSKLAQMFPKFKPFYDLAVKSRLKEDSFKKRYMESFDKAWSNLSKEQKDKLEEIFIIGDKIGRELTDEEFIELEADEAVRNSYKEIRKLLDHMRDLINRVNKLTGRELIGYIPAYFPHHWDMYKVVDKKSHEVTCHKSFKEAMDYRDAINKQGANAYIEVDEGSFHGNITESGMKVSHVLDGSDFEGIPHDFLESDKYSISEKHRWLKQLLSRKGMKGYSTNVEHVLRKYINSTSRYLALEPFKYETRILFENVFGKPLEYDLSSDALANYTKGYINGICGYPTNLEKHLDHIISQVPQIRDFIVRNTSYGTRYSVGLANMMTEAVAVTTLGFWNPACGILQLSQLANVSTLCGNKLTKEAIERLASGKLTDDDKLALRRSKVEFDSNLAREGYSKGTKSSYNDKIQYLAQKSMWMFEKGDMFVRKVAIMAGYQQGLEMGLSSAEAIKHAVDVNRKSNFDNSVVDSSGMFRSLDLLGQVGLQFKKYGLKQLEFCYDTLITSKDKEQKMRFLTTMVLISGIMGIPFLDFFDEILKGLFGKNINEDLRQYALENAGDGAQRAVIEFALYGAGSVVGVDLSRRAGQAGLLGGATENFFPAVGRVFSLIKHVRENGITSQAIADIIPSAGNLATGMIEGHPRGITKVQYTPYERFIRSTGFIPLREAEERDKQRYSMNHNDKDSKKSSSGGGSVGISSLKSIGRKALESFGTVTSLTGIDYLVFEGVGVGKKSARVVRVIDGDTFVTDSGETIRMLGVDTPETSKPFKFNGKSAKDSKGNLVYEPQQKGGKEAKDFTSESLVGKEVILSRDWTDTDDYGRSLRYVTLKDGTDFNKRLIDTGHAKLLVIGTNRRNEATYKDSNTKRKQKYGVLGNE